MSALAVFGVIGFPIALAYLVYHTYKLTKDL